MQAKYLLYPTHQTNIIPVLNNPRARQPETNYLYNIFPKSTGLFKLANLKLLLPCFAFAMKPQ